MEGSGEERWERGGGGRGKLGKQGERTIGEGMRIGEKRKIFN